MNGLRSRMLLRTAAVFAIGGAIGVGAAFAVSRSHRERLALADDAPRATNTSLTAPTTSAPPIMPAAADAESAADITRVVGFGHVDVEGGTSPLSVPSIGQVAEILVSEGDRVKAGQPLIRLRSEAAAAQVIRAQAAVEEAEVSLQQSKRGPANHNFQVGQQTQAVAAAKARMDGQKRTVEKLEKLNESKAVTDENYQAATDLLRQAEAGFKAEELKLEQLKLVDPQENFRLATAAVEAAKAQLAMAREALDNHTLKAPENGAILRILVARGQVLGQNQTSPAIWFCPDKSRIVRCEIDQEFAGRVHPGMIADVFDDKVPDARWVGTVDRTADWIAPRRSMLDEPFQRNDIRTLETIVQLDPNQPMLRIGQRMRVVLRPGQSKSVAAGESSKSASSPKPAIQPK